MPTTTSQKTTMDAAVRHLVDKYSPHSNRVGWLMMASILVEAWDLYGIAFVLIFIRNQYHPDPLLLGLAGAGTQGGAVIGALIGGWLTDRIGRRFMFLATMIMFIVLAVAPGVRHQRRNARRHPFLPRHSARQRHLDRLHLHHGRDGQGQTRGDGQPLAVHVRCRRSFDARGHRDLPHSQHEPRIGVARNARTRRRAGADDPRHASRPARDRRVARPPGPLPRGQGGRQEDVRRPARHAARPGRRGLETSPCRLPRRRPAGSSPLARHALRLDRLLRPGHRVLDFRLLSAGAVRDGRASRRFSAPIS